jgi:hypothetical protein
MDLREYRMQLLTAIENRAKCPAVYIQTQPVRLSIDGQVVWNGKVDIFQLKEHPQAQQAFGWGVEKADKKMEYITVMGIPPLDTPLAAVKGYVASRKT